jgi:hypothetical protein
MVRPSELRLKDNFDFSLRPSGNIPIYLIGMKASVWAGNKRAIAEYGLLIVAFVSKLG